MASGITINGINSGLDIKGIVNSLVAAEKAPKEAQLNRLESSTTAKFTGVGQLKSAIADLQKTLKELNKPELFENRTAVSSDTKLVSGTATKDALSGIYKVTVDKLATASKVASAAISGGSGHTFASGGTLKISLGSEALPEIQVAENASLKDIRDAINTQLKDKGVSANIVTDPKTNTSQLVLSSDKTGAGNDITVAGTGDLARLDIPAFDESSPAPGVSYISMAADAEFSVDGLALKSSTNSVEGAIEGVTLNLTAKTEAGKPITLTVDQDKAGVKDNVKKFVDAYNKLMEVTTSLTGVIKVGDGKPPLVGALVGDSSVRALLSTIRNEFTKTSGDSGIRMLADMGVTTQKDGTLKIDDKQLDKVLSENFEAVATLFIGDYGLMARLDAKLDPYTQTGGLLQQRLDGLQATTKSVETQREALALRVDKMQIRLLAQFNAMDSLMGQLNQTSDRLSQSLASLPGLVKN